MARAGRDHDVATDRGLLAHLDAGVIHEVGTATPHDDSRLRKALLVLLRRRVGEGALEADQVRPAEGQTRCQDALALHAAAPVHQIRNAGHDLLGVAPAQLPGSSEGAVIDDGHAPAGLAAGIGDALGGRASPQDNHINGCCHHSRFPSWNLCMVSRASFCPSVKASSMGSRWAEGVWESQGAAASREEKNWLYAQKASRMLQQVANSSAMRSDSTPERGSKCSRRSGETRR